MRVSKKVSASDWARAVLASSTAVSGSKILDMFDPVPDKSLAKARGEGLAVQWCSPWGTLLGYQYTLPFECVHNNWQ
jgi:hypothetical protein